MVHNADIGAVARIALLAAAVVASAGCADAGADAGWATTVDTLPGGIRHVVNVPPASGGGPSWAIDEELRIGTVDGGGPASFGQIKAIVVDDDGRIVVLDAQAQELRVFGPDGAHITTYGGQGAGPGEFESAFGIARAPDGRLFVPDHTNARMSILHPDSGFITSHPLPFYSFGFIWNGVLADDGNVLMRSMSPTSRRDLLRVYSQDMTQLDTIVLPERPAVDPDDPPGSFAWQAPSGMPRGYASVPYFSNGATILDSSGQFWSAGYGDPSYRIARVTPSGDTTLVIETRREAVPVTSAERDSAVGAILENLEQFGVTSLDVSKVPAVKAAVTSMFRSEDGQLWVRIPSTDSLPHYDIYDDDGRLTGSVVMPFDVVTYVPPFVRGDAFHAVVTDDMGVQYVVRARIHRNLQ